MWMGRIEGGRAGKFCTYEGRDRFIGFTILCSWRMVSVSLLVGVGVIGLWLCLRMELTFLLLSLVDWMSLELPATHLPALYTLDDVNLSLNCQLCGLAAFRYICINPFFSPLAAVDQSSSLTDEICPIHSLHLIQVRPPPT